MAKTTPWEYTNDRKYVCMTEVSSVKVSHGIIKFLHTFRTHGLLDKSYKSKCGHYVFDTEQEAVDAVLRVKNRWLANYNNDLAYESFNGEAPSEEFTVASLWRLLNDAVEPVVIDMFPWGYQATLDACTIVVQSLEEGGRLGNPWYVGDDQAAETSRTDRGLLIYDQQGFPMVWQYKHLANMASNMEPTDCY